MESWGWRSPEARWLTSLTLLVMPSRALLGARPRIQARIPSSGRTRWAGFWKAGRLQWLAPKSQGWRGLRAQQPVRTSDQQAWSPSWREEARTRGGEREEAGAAAALRGRTGRTGSTTTVACVSGHAIFPTRGH